MHHGSHPKRPWGEYSDSEIRELKQAGPGERQAILKRLKREKKRGKRCPMTGRAARSRPLA